MAHLTTASLTVGELAVNCWFLVNEDRKEALVFDPGDEAERIRSYAEQKGWKIAGILLTHGHYDHTGAAAELSAAFPKAEVYIHEKDYRDVDPSLFPLHTELAGVHF